MKKIICFLIFLPSLLTAQEKEMNGVIYADSIHDYQVNIININQKIGSVSNSKGEYSIRAQVGDSVLFTSLQHKTYTIEVADKNLKTSTSIFLELQINELPEVTLNQYNLTGDLSSDITQVKTRFIDQRQFGFGVPRELSKIDREINSANSDFVGGIVNHFNGNNRKLKLRKDNSIVQSNKNRIMRNVSSQLITKDLNIPKLYVEDFAYFCADDEHTISVMDKNDPLALIDELKQKAVAFLYLKEIKE